MDSTNADREGQSVSEKEILPHLEKLFSAEKGALFQGKMSMSDLVIQEPKQSARNSRLKSLGVKKNNGIPLER
jgi:mRNA degradation ribonuclease J1/J2